MDEDQIVDWLNDSSGTTFVTDGDHTVAYEDLDFSVDASDVREAELAIPWDSEDLEVTFTVELEPDTETVVCPGCGKADQVPVGVTATLVSEGPIPCVWCGYPLR